MLETFKYTRVGGKVEHSADVRVVCATNRDLLAMAQDGKFREDLYYRINIFPITLPPAQDHKAAFDGDTGPNTGGMGAYCPAPIVDDKLLRSIEEHILVPTVHAMKRSRQPFRGVLFAGLMLTPLQGPKVLEYNVRFGDPEYQPLLMRVQSDLVDVMDATIDGKLDELPPLRWDARPSVCVVMASEGYPGDYEKGRSAGWEVVSLGPRLLRVETAALALAAWFSLGQR